MLDKKVIATLALIGGWGIAFASYRGRLSPAPALDAQVARESHGGKPQVVVLGADFAGMAAASDIARSLHQSRLGEVVFTDRNS